MSESPEVDFQQWAANDEQRLRKLVDNNARAIKRSARWRSIRRWSLYGGGSLGILLMALGIYFELYPLAGIGVLFVLLGGLSTVPLFLLGGIAPTYARMCLS